MGIVRTPVWGGRGGRIQLIHRRGEILQASRVIKGGRHFRRRSSDVGNEGGEAQGFSEKSAENSRQEEVKNGRMRKRGDN